MAMIMLDEVENRAAPAASVTTRTQRFSVDFEFPVTFCRGLFRPENPVLLDTLRRIEPHKRHRVLFFIDAGVLAARPELTADIEAYCAHHSRSVELASQPIVIEGGEAVKQGLA